MAAERLKLAVIGDPHLGVARGDPDPRLEVDPGRKLHGLSVELLTQTIAEINAAPGVDAAIVLGDLTRDSELFNHEVARAVLGKLTMPYYIVIGNHDLLRQRPNHVTYPDEPRLDRDSFIESYRGAGLPGETTRYVVELPGDVMLVVLDSNRTLADLRLERGGVWRQDHGWVDPLQRRWLHEMLANIRALGRTPLVAVHHSVTDHSPAERLGHPLRRIFAHWQVHGARLLRRVLARHRVPLVLSGHLHAQSVNTHDGVTNLVTAASVSYPHAWRLLTFTEEAIEVESHPLASIPSCPDLQEQSRRWLADGMGEIIEKVSLGIPLFRRLSGGIRDFVMETGWWPRFCDGTQAGLTVADEDLPQGGRLTTMVYRRLTAMLAEYGSWKASRPDPNTLSIPLKPR